MGNNTHCRHLSQRKTGTLNCPDAVNSFLAAQKQSELTDAAIADFQIATD